MGWALPLSMYALALPGLGRVTPPISPQQGGLWAFKEGLIDRDSENRDPPMQPLSDRHYHSSTKVDWGRSCDSLHTGANLPRLSRELEKDAPEALVCFNIGSRLVYSKVQTRCARMIEWTLREETKNDFAVTWA